MNNSLRQAALDVIVALQSIPRWSQTNIAVVGGLARLNYSSRGRLTSDVDFIVECPVMESFRIAKDIRQDLNAFNSSAFVEGTTGLFHNQALPDGGPLVSHRVSFYSTAHFPYLPPLLQEVRNIPQGAIPYIPLADLIVFKIHTCGLRPSLHQMRSDVLDAKEMLGLPMSPLVLTQEQQDALRGRLADVTTCDPFNTPAQWWRQRLGLPANFN